MRLLPVRSKPQAPLIKELLVISEFIELMSQLPLRLSEFASSHLLPRSRPPQHLGPSPALAPACSRFRFELIPRHVACTYIYEYKLHFQSEQPTGTCRTYIFLPDYLPTCLPTCPPYCLPACMHACLGMCMQACIRGASAVRIHTSHRFSKSIPCSKRAGWGSAARSDYCLPKWHPGPDRRVRLLICVLEPRP